ncbi:MAG TPA: M48 family metalloprotease [Chroococcales cyanobacterium]
MASIPNPSLEDGLAALNQRNYPVAIAHLEGVCETELDESLVTRASRELVTAYRRNGNAEKAIALCQRLTQHDDPQVRQWAASTLTDLTVENPVTSSSPASEVAGFVPLDGQPANQAASDSTGFVALGKSPSKPQTPLKRIFSKNRPQSPGTTQPASANPKTQTPSQTRVADTPRTPVEPTTDNSSSRLPATYSAPSTPHPSLFTPRPRWRNGGRAKDWRPLKAPKLIRLWLVEIVTAIALFWVLHFFVQLAMQTTNAVLVQLPFLEPIQLFYRDPTPTLLIFLAILLIASPWLLDWLLKQFHSFEPLSLAQLASRSPESAQVVQRFCRQHKLPVPKLGILPTDVPVALAYGNLPWTARIVVSEGLLLQLADDEMATIYAEQLGHIAHWDITLMSLGVLLLQIPHTIYWQVAQWGEQLPELIGRKWASYPRFLSPILVGMSGVIASLSYGIYWLLRLPLLWFSRARLYYSDRLAVETTGNPNGMTRALLKMGLGIADDIQTNGATSGLIESFDLLLPVGYRQALTLGSCSPQTSFEAMLNWDCTNFYRDWLIVSASHPLLGERMHLLARYAHFWKIGTELDLPPLAPPIRDNAAQLSKLSNSYKALPLLQSAVFFGLLLGLGLRLVLWTIGQIGDRFNIWQVIWMHNASPFLNACILIAFSLSIFLWINRYFPDIKPSTTRSQPNLADLFANPTTLPPDSQPVQVTGKLLGRRGLLNWLGQDLILQTSTGLVKLYFWSYLGPLGNLLPTPTRPSDAIERQVTVNGWFRRGATPWIDIETLRTEGGSSAQANYPLWLTILAFIAAVWGAYLIWQA